MPRRLAPVSARRRSKAAPDRSRRRLAAAIGLALLLGGGAARAETLVVWDNYPEAERTAVVEQLIERFEAANPGVQVERTPRSVEDLSLTLKLNLSSGNGPMVAQVNQGAGDMGALVAAGLLRPLDPWMRQYGWDRRVSASALQRNQWSKDGAFGTGETYGIAPLGEMVGLYYNEQVLAQNGVAVPRTFEELELAMATLKEKGVVPMMMGNVDGVGSMQLYAILQQLHVGAAEREAEDDLVYGRGGSFKATSFGEAAETLLAWDQKGYFFPGYQGISRADAVSLYVQDQAAFLISGSWYSAELQANKSIRFTQVPPLGAVQTPLVEGGTDLALGITSVAKSEAQQDMAAKYIDFMMSEEAAEAWAAAGLLPDKSMDDPGKATMGPLLADIFAVWQKLNKEDALGHYLDWASPTMYNTLTENLPKLIAGSLTPDQLTTALDADYQGYLKTKTAPK